MWFLMIACLTTWGDTSLFGQDRFKDFSATGVFREINAGVSSSPGLLNVDSWWDRHVQNSMREVQPLPTDLHTVLFLAIHHSNQIKIAKQDPLIRETAVQEADSAFDWVRYVDAAWNDTSEPVGNALTVGGEGTRFDDQQFVGTAGVRRTTRTGGQLDISQRFGWQNNNSTFFIPDNQATGQFTVSYSHPLLRGRGAAFNNSIVFLAQVDSQVANDEFLAIMQDELLEITRAYWNLRLERSVLAHQLRLYLRTKEVYQTLTARQSVDAQGTQAVLAASALETRRADLIRSQTAVTNSETRLRGMINAQELGNSDEVELIPVEPLPAYQYQTDLQQEIFVALQNRPELRAAIHQVKAGSIRLGVAEHELLPALNLVTEGFLSGLQGDSDFGDAFVDQFSEGRPSYSLGIQYELPVGNRLAKARVCRRRHELTQLQTQYARALETVKTEVDIAVRELRTALQEIEAKRRALAAAEAEVTTIEKRWKLLVDGSGTSSLNLESLLRAQERVTAAEREYVTSQLTYSLAMVNLKRSNGTLLQSDAVSVQPTCGPNGCRDIQLGKGNPNVAASQGFIGEPVGAPGAPGCGCGQAHFAAANGANTPTISQVSGQQVATGNQWQSTVNAGVVQNSADVSTPWGSANVDSHDALNVAFGSAQRANTAPQQPAFNLPASFNQAVQPNDPFSNAANAVQQASLPAGNNVTPLPSLSQPEAPASPAATAREADNSSIFTRLPKF